MESDRIMNATIFSSNRRGTMWLVPLIACALSIVGPRARAQEMEGSHELSPTEKYGRIIIGQFAGISGYWFTDASATRAIGTPKFGGDAVFYVKPAHRLGGLLTGGIEVAGANDH